MIKIIAIISMISVVSLGLPLVSQAASKYPAKPITLIVPYPPGGSTDTASRIMAEEAGKILKQKIIVKNVSGGGGSVGANTLVNSDPDGYTIGTLAFSLIGIVPQLRQVPYKPLSDFTHLLAFGQYLFGLVVKADAPWKTFEEFIAYAKAHPDKLTYSTTGVGAPSHIGILQLSAADKLKFRAVPFKGGAAAVKAVLGGQVDFHAGTGQEIVPNVNGGRLKFLLSLSDRRWPQFPKVPSLKDKGYGFYLYSYISIAAPKGLAEAKRVILAKAFTKAASSAAVKKVMNKFGLPIVIIPGPEYKKFCDKEYGSITKSLKEAGVIK
ncbi:MAG: tripartite tricarboxylate transporter substrate binding protein [Thermodesulfobacteriota bacterium]